MVVHGACFYPWAETQWVNGTEVCVNADSHADYSAIRKASPVCTVDPDAPKVDRRRRNNGCPAGWFEYDSKRGVCRPPASYQGPCSEIVIDEFAGVAGMRRIADRCRVLWPFIKDPPFPNEQEQDFDQPCPAGWTPSGASPNDVYCSAPETYTGRCKSIQNFASIRPEEKVVFAHLCEAPWPLKAIPTTFDFNFPCPKGWDLLKETNTCKAPPPPVYVPTDGCPSTVPSFGVPEKIDAFPSPTTPFDNTETISESTLRKFEFMRKCHVDWPRLEGGQDPPKQVQPVIFNAMDKNSESKRYICPGGYHSVKGYNVPMCVENARANSACAPLLLAGKAETPKNTADFLSKYGDCVKVA